MSDAWEEIQAIKSKRNSLRERLEKRKKERRDILGSTTGSNKSSPVHSIDNSNSSPAPASSSEEIKVKAHPDEEEIDLMVKIDPELEQELLKSINEVALQMPVTSLQLIDTLKVMLNQHSASHREVCNLLQKFSTQKLIMIKDAMKDHMNIVEVTFVDVAKVNAMIAEFSNEPPKEKSFESLKRKADDNIDKADEEEKKKREKKEPKTDIMVGNYN